MLSDCIAPEVFADSVHLKFSIRESPFPLGQVPSTSLVSSLCMEANVLCGVLCCCPQVISGYISATAHTKLCRYFLSSLLRGLVPEFVFSSCNFKILSSTGSLVFCVIYTIVMSECSSGTKIQSATRDPEREDHHCSEEVTHEKVEE